MRGAYHCSYVTASLLLTAAFLAVGVSFFGPFWLSNITPAVYSNELEKTGYVSYLNDVSDISECSERGLWAQCGAECHWFWADNYLLQTTILTPLSKYIG
jgi:hypothetical protein